MKRTIMFVCKGNIHRSVVAEICLRQELKKLGLNNQFEVMSRGIQGCCGTIMSEHGNMTKYEMEWSITKPILEKLGVNLSGIENHIACSVRSDDAKKADVVYAMQLDVLGGDPNGLASSLLHQFPEYSSRMHFFGEIEGDNDEMQDCAKSENQKLHLLINERIVHGIRNNVQFILNQAVTGGEMIDIKHILKDHAYQNIPLNYEEAYGLGVYALEGCRGNKLAQKQSIAALCALHTKATYAWKRTPRSIKIHGHRLPVNAAEQIAGICAAVFNHDIAVSKLGFLNPDVPYAMDNCGMGGDIIDTANVSTVAAFIAAAAGIFMCKHGSPGNTRRIGSSEFVSVHCNINVKSAKKKAEKCLEDTHFCYTEALDTRYKRIHSQTHKIAMLPHMNDIIGPITNPFNPQKMIKRVVGVNHLIAPLIVAEAYRIMNEKGITNLRHGLFVRGFADKNRYEGMDEVSICCGGTQVAELKNGKIREYSLYAKDFGLKAVPVETIIPKENKGEFSLKILKGEISGAPLQMILANAAILFYLAGKSQDLKECYKMAEEIHRSGKAYEAMLAVQRMLPK